MRYLTSSVSTLDSRILLFGFSNFTTTYLSLLPASSPLYLAPSTLNPQDSAATVIRGVAISRNGKDCSSRDNTRTFQPACIEYIANSSVELIGNRSKRVSGFGGVLDG